MVELKKKVTLRTKTPEAPEEVQKQKVVLKKKQPMPDPIPPSPPTGGDEEPKGKGKWYAVALAGLLVLGGGGYYLSHQGEDELQSVVVVAGTGQSDDVTKGETTEGNQNEQSQEGETPADAATAENPSDDTSAGESSTGETPAAETPTTPGSKTNATAPTFEPTPASPSASQPVQEKTKVNPAQTKPVTGPSDATGAVEEEAKEVIRGKYGNGDVRKRNLGDRYAEIQNKVNEMYRNGQVQ